MKTLIAAALVPFLAISCATKDVSSIPITDNSTADALFKDVNRYRASVGKPPLVRHSGLDALAQQHSEFMKKNGRKPNHISFSSRGTFARAKFNMDILHENTATGPRGTSITRVWAASRSHAPAMRGNWTYTGVGVAVDKNGYLYATQIFGSGGLQRRPGSF